MSWPDRVAGLVLVASVGRDVHDGAARAWIAGDNPLIPREADVERFMALVLERPPPVGRAVIRHVITQRVRRADALHRLFRGFVLADGDAGVPRDLGGLGSRRSSSTASRTASSTSASPRISPPRCRAPSWS